MYVPENYDSEEEVLEIIERCAKRLANKFKFGYYDADDIVQEAVILVINTNCLEKYDTSRPLENFISSHLRKRLYNFKRDNYMRPNPPCSRCPLKAFIKPDICTAYKDKMDCKFYKRWDSNNIKKRNIMNTININRVDDDDEDSMSLSKNFIKDISKKDAHIYIMDKLSFRMRKFYLMFLNNCKLGSSEKKLLFAEISRIRNNAVE